MLTPSTPIVDYRGICDGRDHSYFSRITATQAPWIDVLGLALYATLGLALTARFFSWAPRV